MHIVAFFSYLLISHLLIFSSLTFSSLTSSHLTFPSFLLPSLLLPSLTFIYHLLPKHLLLLMLLSNKEEFSKYSDPRNEVPTRYLRVLNVTNAMWKRWSHFFHCPKCSIVCHVILQTDVVSSITCLEWRNERHVGFRDSKQVILNTMSVNRITWQTILHKGHWRRCDRFFHIALGMFRTIRYLVETSFRGSLHLLISSFFSCQHFFVNISSYAFI